MLLLLALCLLREAHQTNSTMYHSLTSIHTIRSDLEQVVVTYSKAVQTSSSAAGPDDFDDVDQSAPSSIENESPLASAVAATDISGVVAASTPDRAILHSAPLHKPAIQSIGMMDPRGLRLSFWEYLLID